MFQVGFIYYNILCFKQVFPFNGYVILFKDVNECLNLPCFNGGTCINNAGSFTCNCTDGWEGNECSESKYRDKTYRAKFY